MISYNTPLPYHSGVNLSDSWLSAALGYYSRADAVSGRADHSGILFEGKTSSAATAEELALSKKTEEFGNYRAFVRMICIDFSSGDIIGNSLQYRVKSTQQERWVNVR